MQGKGIAEKFVQEGATVVIADFMEDVGRNTANELKCDFHRTDVTKKEDWESLKNFCDERYGKIDCVINNAGTTYRNKVSSTGKEHVAERD